MAGIRITRISPPLCKEGLGEVGGVLPHPYPPLTKGRGLPVFQPRVAGSLWRFSPTGESGGPSGTGGPDGIGAAGGGGDDDGGVKKKATGRATSYLQLATTFSEDLTSTLEGLAMAAIVSADKISADALSPTLRVMTRIKLKGAMSASLPQSKLSTFVHHIFLLHEGVNIGDWPDIETAFSHLGARDQQMVGVILRHECPEITHHVFDTLRKLAVYQTVVWDALNELEREDGEFTGELGKALFDQFIRYPSWDLQTSIVDIAHDEHGQGVVRFLRDCALTRFAQDVLERIAKTSWPAGHPLWTTGISRLAKDPFMRAQIVSQLKTWPLELLAQTAWAEDDVEMQSGGEGEFEGRVWTLFEELSGREPDMPIVLRSSRELPEALAEARARRDARIERAIGNVVSRLAIADPLFAAWRDEVVERVTKWACGGKGNVETLRKHPAKIVDRIYSELVKERGSRQLFAVLENEILPRFVGADAPMMGELSVRRRDPTGWTWFVASEVFASEESLRTAAIADLDELRAMARLLYIDYRGQLKVLEEVMSEHDKTAEYALPRHVRLAFRAIGTSMQFRQGRNPETLRQPLKELLEEVVRENPILEAEGMSKTGRMAVDVGLNLKGAYNGADVDPLDPEVVGTGMAEMAHVAFNAITSFPGAFDGPLKDIAVNMHAVAFHLIEVVDWLSSEPNDSAGRQAFNAHWRKVCPDAYEDLLRIVRGVLWVGNAGERYFNITARAGEGIAGLKISRAKGSQSRVTVRFNGRAPSSDGAPGRMTGRAPVTDDTRRGSEIAALVDVVRAMTGGSSSPAHVIARWFRGPRKPSMEWVEPIFRSLINNGVLYGGDVEVMATRGEGVRSRSILSYVHGSDGMPSNVVLPPSDLESFKTLYQLFSEMVPEAQFSQLVFSGRLSDGVERDDLMDMRLLGSGPTWLLTDGNDVSFYRVDGRLVSDDELGLVEHANYVGLGQLIRVGTERYNWPLLDPLERHEVLNVVAQTRTEHPHVAREYEKKGWDLFVKRAVTAVLLETRHLPIFLTRMAREVEGQDAALRNLRGYMHTDKLAGAMSSEKDALAAIRAQWEEYDRRVEEAARILWTVMLETSGAETSDFNATLDWFGGQISAADKLDKQAMILAQLSHMLALQRDLRRAHEAITSMTEFAPTQEALMEYYFALMLPEEVAIIAGDRRGAGGPDRAWEVRSRINGDFALGDEFAISTLQELSSLWRNLLENYPYLRGWYPVDLRNLRGRIGALSPEKRAELSELLGYGLAQDIMIELSVISN